jgi:hypothetical protein
LAGRVAQNAAHRGGFDSGQRAEDTGDVDIGDQPISFMMPRTLPPRDSTRRRVTPRSPRPVSSPAWTTS